ncbi:MULTISPECIES: YybS family protein [Priestia]|uniref:YybS family protein n=1 Tax=Priestia TaxID=2800373 RepID=UPI001C8F1D67|nr:MULTISPECIES: YybS family protein [Priestia]MBY0063543.1 YybS family protein [Priestia aryabhattai]MDN3365338.1 YybS family protein [Priestia megaterium]WKU23782.1 YybS family protein [Priestia megaterium]
MKGIRYITEGAALLALFVALMLASLYIPLLGVILAFVLGVPFIVFTMRHGFGKAVLFFIVAVLLTILFGTLKALPITFIFGIGGTMIGVLYAKKQSRYITLLGGTIAFAFGFLLWFVLTISLLHINLSADQWATTVNESIDRSIKLSESLGQSVSQQQIERTKDSISMLKYIIPTFLVVVSAVFSLITQAIAAPILKRLGHEVEKFPPIRALKLPKSVLWYYLITLILTFPMFNFEQGSFMYIVILNMLALLQMLVVLQGISFIFYFSHQKGYAKAIPIVVTILALIIPIILQIVRILGIIDLGFNLRKQLDTKK